MLALFTDTVAFRAQFFRQEMLHASVKPINADVFTGFVGANGKADNEEARNLHNMCVTPISSPITGFDGCGL